MLTQLFKEREREKRRKQTATHRSPGNKLFLANKLIGGVFALLVHVFSYITYEHAYLRGKLLHSAFGINNLSISRL